MKLKKLIQLWAILLSITPTAYAELGNLQNLFEDAETVHVKFCFSDQHNAELECKDYKDIKESKPKDVCVHYAFYFNGVVSPHTVKIPFSVAKKKHYLLGRVLICLDHYGTQI